MGLSLDINRVGWGSWVPFASCRNSSLRSGFWKVVLLFTSMFRHLVTHSYCCTPVAPSERGPNIKQNRTICESRYPLVNSQFAMDIITIF